MVQYTQAAATPSDEQYRQAIDREPTNFEERERQLMAEERRERAAKLGLVLRGIPEYPRQTSRWSPGRGVPAQGCDYGGTRPSARVATQQHNLCS